MEIRVAPDCEVTFIDAPSVTGHMLELYPDHPYLREIYAEVTFIDALEHGTAPN